MIVQIPEHLIEFIFSRSSGPGGQNVNKVNTQVTAIFNLAGSTLFTEEQKQLILAKLANRIDKVGNLQITSNLHRSQRANRLDAVDRLHRLIASALIKPRPRKPTKVSFAAKQRRLKAKKIHSLLKKKRSGRDLEDKS